MLELLIAIVAVVGVGVCLVIQARGIAQLRAEIGQARLLRGANGATSKPKRWLTWPPQSHAQT